MDEEWGAVFIALAIAVFVIAIGGLFITRSHYGNTEAAILYLAGVLAAGLFWNGRK